MPRLLWRDAQGIEGSLDLTSAEIRIGRAMDCAIRTDDAMVSRHHSRIFSSTRGYVLEDLQSANGVYFQEQRVQQHVFKHGDAVRCGSLWLRFVDTTQMLKLAALSATAPQPMMQHPGLGAVPAGGPTGHVSSVIPAVAAAESDAEIRVLRRRVEQLQTELRVYRAQKFDAETARRMEDLENDVSTIEIERDNLKSLLDQADRQLALEVGSVKVKRALEITALTSETAASLNDLLSSLRIEVMAAEGELEQYARDLPRASFDLIRQSMKDASSHCEEARELLKKLRAISE